MATTETRTAPDAVDRPVRETDGMLALLKSLQTCSSRPDAWRRSLRCIASQFNSPFATLEVDSSSGTLTDRVSASHESDNAWRRHCDGMLLATRQSGTARARMFQTSQNACSFAILSAPVPDDAGAFVGSVAVVVACESNGVAEAKLSELSSLIRAAAVLGVSGGRQVADSKFPVGGPGIGSEKTQHTAQTRTNAAAAISRIGQCESLHEFAFTLVNDLKGRIGADQVVMSFVSGGRPKILAISGFDNLNSRSPGNRIIEQAMAECIDAGETVCCQRDGQWAKEKVSTGHHLHRRWHESSGGVPVVSIPLLHAGKCVAVLSIRRPADKPFESAQLQKISTAVAMYAPALKVLEHANRSILRHVTESCSNTIRKSLGAHPARRTAILVTSLACASWIMLRDTDFIVTVPCEVAPAREVQLAAPFQGEIAETFVRSGERVQAGQPLLRMDTKTLEAEYEEARTSLEIAHLELTQSAADGDLAKTALADSKVRVAENSMARVQYYLDQAEVTAPSDGYVLEGELVHRVGEAVPMGEPLLKFAGSDDWILRLHVPEHSAAYLDDSMAGEFTLNARPDIASSLFLEQMEISADVINGQNSFVARAGIRGVVSPWIRSGMLGTARVNAGSKPTWWVWFHKIVDSVRLQVWKW
jgi:hypothetical protein